MKIDYDYKVLRLEPGGMATVEYKSKDLGSVVRVFVIPYDRGVEQVRRRVIEKFPLDLFYSRYLARSPPESTMAAYVSGKMSIDFDDSFYDVQEMMTRDDIETPSP